MFLLLKTQCCMPRRTRPPSLSLDTVPIPPSLLTSPFLSSPVFTHSSRSIAPRLPTEQEELWLQDTVPLPVSPSPEGSSGSLLTPHPIKPSQRLYRRPAPQSPPIVVNRPPNSHIRGHTYPEGYLSNCRNSYSHSGSSSEPQSPISSSSSSCRSSLPCRPPDAVDPRPPRRLKFTHVRIHSNPDLPLPTHIESICFRNVRKEQSRRAGGRPHMEFGCGRAASD